MLATAADCADFLFGLFFHVAGSVATDGCKGNNPNVVDKNDVCMPKHQLAGTRCTSPQRVVCFGLITFKVVFVVVVKSSLAVVVGKSRCISIIAK